MRVAQMLDTLRVGGAQKMQVFLVQSLCPLGIEVTVINLRNAPDPFIVSELEKAGARVVTFPFQRMFSPRSFLRLVDFLHKEQFDLLHAYLTYSNIIGPIAGWLSSTPVIGSFRSAAYDEKNTPRIRILLENLALKYLASRVTANGHSVGEYGKKRLGNIPIDVIVNAVDLTAPPSDQERRRLRQELVGNPEHPIIFSAGRLTPQKGFLELLEAFHQVHQIHPQAVLVIAGGGQMKNEMEELARALGLGNKVMMLGFRDDVRALMSVADIYVNSSHREGTPVSVLEAMAARLPIIATSVGESPYLLDADCGLLVPAKDTTALAVAIEGLLDSPNRRLELGASAFARVKREFSRDAWRANLLNLYSQVTPLANQYLTFTAEQQKAGAG